MAKIYYNLINAGLKIYDVVPNPWKLQVKDLYKMDVKDGIITAEKYKEVIGEDYVA